MTWQTGGKMRLSQYIEHQPERRRSSRKKTAGSVSVVKHASFIPMVTAWGAALFGLSVMVLPATAIGRMAILTGLAADGVFTRFVLAGLAALIGGAFGFMAAGAIRSTMAARSGESLLITAMHSRRPQPIDPASELGSESFDAPLETMPFDAVPVKEDTLELTHETSESTADSGHDAHDQPLLARKPSDAGDRAPTLGELAKRGYEMEAPEDAVPAKGKETEMSFTHKQFQRALIESCEAATCEAAAESETPAPSEAEKQPHNYSTLPERPQELDLAEFAELPGRNGVWVEEQPKVDAEPARIAREPRPAPPAAGALEKLRQTPPEQLSLVEMVERFAAALHERQQADRQRASNSGPARDAALAEALKALTFFTSQDSQVSQTATGQVAKPHAEDPRIASTERELREALAKLQDLRGAA